MTYAVDFNSLIDAYRGGQISFDQLIARLDASSSNASERSAEPSTEGYGIDGDSGEPGTSKGGGQSPILKLTEHSDGVDKLELAYNR